MTRDEHQAFQELLRSVYSFYRVELTPFHIEVWWNAMRALELEAVRDAFNRHVMNPDNGQFVPKPADIVKLTGGGTAERALLAWTKFELAVQHVGAWDTVVFDDPIIHQVVDDMGGWRELCAREEKEWPFARNEFVQRYRGYANTRLMSFPGKLIGHIEAANAAHYPDRVPAPRYIGDEGRARNVLLNGAAQGHRLAKIGELVNVQQPSRLLGDKS